jgi:hypothetical protein
LRLNVGVPTLLEKENFAFPNILGSNEHEGSGLLVVEVIVVGILLFETGQILVGKNLNQNLNLTGLLYSYPGL